MRPRGRALATTLAVVTLLAGCSDGAPKAGAAAGQAQQEAQVRVADLVMRASVVPTETLGEAVAAQYRIERDADTVMVLVGIRRDSGTNEMAVPANIRATATDLLGKRQPIDLHEVRSGVFVDYAGTVAVIAPDTLRFDISANVDGAPTLEMQFNRDFFPR